METLFSFFFKYRPFYFQEGEFTFQGGLSYGAIVLLLAAGGLLVWTYRSGWVRARGQTGWTLMGLRGLFFLLLFLLAMRPSLVLSRLVPKENLIAVVADNSRSMGILDNLGLPRAHQVPGLLEQGSDFLTQLDERFFVRRYRFDQRTERLSQSSALDWSGDQTNIVSALDWVLSDTRNLPLAGIVLFTDGSDNSHLNIEETLAELQTRQIPVHTVGVGPEFVDRDVELTHVATPRVAIPESVSTARLTFRQRGFGGSRGRLEVREGDTLVHSQEVYFPRDSETFTSDVRIVPKTKGIKYYRFTLGALEGEKIEENNQQTAIIQVRDLPSNILYVEGHPRWEYKFIRRALEGDQHLRLVTLLRTALNKFYRQGIDEETTLATGFPSQIEELFEYQGLLFGNVESSFFSYHQMEMVRDFVGRRGGGFLMLGGSASFGSGRYQNTPIEEILPVWLNESQDSSSGDSLYVQGESPLKLTDQGHLHPALQLSLSEEEASSAWDKIPKLRDWNLIRATKSGATILARLETSDGSGQKGELPLVVFQRYGRGHTLALLTGSSWQWQMLQDHRDQTHETFWRQILRWLVSSATDPVTVETERKIYSQNEIVDLRAEVKDKAFNPINDARVEATVTSPSGEASTLVLQWDTREDGVYRGQWTPHQDGLHGVSIQATAKTLEEKGVNTETFFLTSTGTREYFDAVQKKDFLQKLSQQTGGDYYSMSQIDSLPEEILYTQSETAVVEILDLWDMPVNLLLLLGLLSWEWVLRRRQGLI